jgi:hypothetical protein
MNTNIINQEQEALNILFSQIPEEEFYSSIVTRAKALALYEKYQNKVTKLPLKPHVVIRAILTRLLRYVDMSVQQLDVLLAIGVNNLTVDVLKMPMEQLIHHLVQENRDTSDVYIIERIVSQINNKLPYDLRPKFTPNHKIDIIKLINNSVAFQDNLKYLKEKVDQDKAEQDKTEQHNSSKFYLTKYGAEGFNDTEGKNTSLNNEYLKSLELDYNDIVNHNDWSNLRSKGYELKDYQDKVTMEIDAGTYETQLKDFLDNKAEAIKAEEDAKDETSLTKILATYVDKYPDLHYSPKDGKFYFYDHASGSLVDADEVNGEFHVEVNASDPKLSAKDKKEFVQMLKEYNIPRNKIDNAVDYIESTELLPDYAIVDGEIVQEEENIPTEEDITKLVVQEEDMTDKSNWIVYLLIGLLLLVVVIAVVYYFLNRDAILNMKFMSMSMPGKTTQLNDNGVGGKGGKGNKGKRVMNNNAYVGKIKKMLKMKKATGNTANNNNGFRKL